MLLRVRKKIDTQRRNRKKSSLVEAFLGFINPLMSYSRSAVVLVSDARLMMEVPR